MPYLYNSEAIVQSCLIALIFRTRLVWCQVICPVTFRKVVTRWFRACLEFIENPCRLRKMGNCPAEKRAQRECSGSLFSCVSIEELILASHPPLDPLNPMFCALYPAEGRPSLPPEQLLLPPLLQAFYVIRLLLLFSSSALPSR